MPVHRLSKPQRNRMLGLAGVLAGYVLALATGSGVVIVLGVGLMLAGATILAINL